MSIRVVTKTVRSATRRVNCQETLCGFSVMEALQAPGRTSTIAAAMAHARQTGHQVALTESTTYTYDARLVTGHD